MADACSAHLALIATLSLAMLHKEYKLNTVAHLLKARIVKPVETAVC
jgi:hypothetical protein